MRERERWREMEREREREREREIERGTRAAAGRPASHAITCPHACAARRLDASRYGRAHDRKRARTRELGIADILLVL